MKTLVAIVALTASLACLGQRTYVYGVVRDSASHQDMIGVHVQNIDAGSLTSTNEYGKFKLPSKPGDTLVFSSVGHKTLAWVATEEWFNGEEVEFLLPVNTIYLDEVVVGEFPEYRRFKDQIIKTQPEDTTFEVFGVPRVVMDPYPQMEKSEYLNPAFVFFHPVSAIHHSVSKKEKEKRKMQQIRKQSHMVDLAEVKFTREWVSESTKLEGDKLTSFIAYCNFSNQYIAATPLYMIHERMMELLPEFLKEYDQG